MKYYLSSFRLGSETEKLAALTKQTSGSFGYIPNALDFTTKDEARRAKHIESDMNDLRAIGVIVELLDLQEYFGKEDALRTKLQTLGGVYVSGGNTFVLRQAMRLCGLDMLMSELSSRIDFLYIAYSAGVCVLSPTMKQYAMADDANDFPYSQIKEQIWEGLGILNFIFEPHYDSDHPESESTAKEIQQLINDKLLFKAYRDGEVLIIE